MLTTKHAVFPGDCKIVTFLAEEIDKYQFCFPLLLPVSKYTNNEFNYTCFCFGELFLNVV